MLFAQRAGDTVFRHYNDLVFDRFFSRKLDIESPEAIASVLEEAGAAHAGGFLGEAEALRADVATISREAEAAGVFGVPSFIVDGELFWGSEHLADIRSLLANPKPEATGRPDPDRY